jgi:hypothetical protein
VKALQANVILQNGILGLEGNPGYTAPENKPVSKKDVFKLMSKMHSHQR